MEKDCKKLLEEALDEVKLYYDNAKEFGDYKTVARIESKFPQLKESEDERIRKGLIKDFRNYYEMYDKSCGEPKWGFDYLLVKDILAWLERRKEMKPVSVVRIPKFKVGDIIQHMPFEKWDRGARIKAIDENGYSIDFTHVGDNVSGGYIGFSFEDEYELVGKKEPAEWSEEDEKMVGRLRSVIRECASYNCALDVNGDYCEGDYAKLDDWLKSLRPQPHWKPNEEQIEALERASTNEYLSAKQFDILVSLCEQLQKL